MVSAITMIRLDSLSLVHAGTASGRILGLGWIIVVAGLVHPARAADTERKALDYLTSEVPRWARENHCHSCHNNGDAARALYDALARGREVSVTAVEETTRWLARPEAWEKNGDPNKAASSDPRLARLQFAAALSAAVSSKALKDRSPLDLAAARLRDDQAADGSWSLDDGGPSVGSPASYGKALATFLARETLDAAGRSDVNREAIARADAWLLARPLASVNDASVALLASSGRAGVEADRLRAQALDLLRKGESADGGWGPFVDAAPEPFDTALALLALARAQPSDKIRRMIRKGRAYLAASQQADGSWIETTRPPGAESYAQRVSTSAWATLALLATDNLER